MYQVGSTCYPTTTAALQAAASSQAGTIVQQGGGAYVVAVDAVAPDGIQYRLDPVGGGVPLTVQSFQDPMPCGLLTFADVSPIAWTIAAGWVAIFAIKSLLFARVDDDT